MSTYDLIARDAGDGTVVVGLAGELDLTNAPELERRIWEAAPEHSGLVLDLNAVEFLDSAVLHVLFRLAAARGEGLAIMVAPEAPAAGTIALVGLEKVARVLPSLESGTPDAS